MSEKTQCLSQEELRNIETMEHRISRTKSQFPAAPHGPIGLLPRELILEIFANLELPQLLCCRLICRLWEVMVRLAPVAVPYPLSLSLFRQEIYFRVFSKARKLIMPSHLEKNIVANGSWEACARLMNPLPQIDLSACAAFSQLNLLQVELDSAKLYELSLPFACRCIELVPTEPVFWSNRGSLFHGMSRLPEALRDIEKALSLCPNNRTALGCKSQVLMDSGRFQEALQVLQRLIDLELSEPNDPAEYFKLLSDRSMVYEELRRWPEALADIDAIRESKHEIGSNTTLSYSRGRILVSLQRYSEALVEFDAVLQMNERDIAAHYRKAMCLEALGRPAEAAVSLNDVLKYPPVRPCEYNALAQVRLRQGDVHAALQNFERADALRPCTLEYLHGVGRCCMKLGRFAEALLAFNRCLELNGHEEVEHERQQVLRALGLLG